MLRKNGTVKMDTARQLGLVRLIILLEQNFASYETSLGGRTIEDAKN